MVVMNSIWCLPPFAMKKNHLLSLSSMKNGSPGIQHHRTKESLVDAMRRKSTL
ncbi:hypothetical protein WDU94_013732 [Cyamophila willieti]